MKTSKMRRSALLFWILVWFAASCSAGTDDLVKDDVGSADSSQVDGSDGSADAGPCSGLEPGMYCDTGDKCVPSGKCTAAGTCEGTPTNCDDGNSCTDDSCKKNTGNCVNESIVSTTDGKPVTCNDANDCTGGDVCKTSGTCVGTPINCDDNNSCTIDSCDTKIGCSHKYNPASSCSDGNPCTQNDHCDNGVCLSGEKIACNDNNPCTIDACDPSSGECTFLGLPEGQGCNDGNACTVGDACKGGACISGQKKVCSDSDQCTTDVCNQASGICEFKFTAFNGQPCDDGNKCTKNETCVEKANGCVSTSVVDCNDGNPCTTDSCDSNGGCVYSSADGISCDDGNACTVGDTCSQKSCKPGKLSCNDNNPCTQDSCNSVGSCVFKPSVSFGCDDGNACTSNDVCDASGSCLGSILSCDDKNACTSDTCDNLVGCKYSNTNGTCSDNNPCTEGDLCKQGVCSPGKDLCNDNNSCTIDACNKETAQCTHTPQPFAATCDIKNNLCAAPKGVCDTQGQCQPVAKCDDGKPCTNDSCDTVSGKCTNDAIPGCVP
jgi:hypothetical protein